MAGSRDHWLALPAGPLPAAVPWRGPQNSAFTWGPSAADRGFWSRQLSILPVPPTLHTLALDEVSSVPHSSPTSTPSHWVPRPSWGQVPPSTWSAPRFCQVKPCSCAPV